MFSRIKPELAPSLVVLAACSCILLGAFILAPSASDGNPIAVGRITFPEICIFQNLTGLPCPGCGMTRSITSAVRGDIAGSLRHHRLGLLTMIYILSQFLLSLGVVFVSKFRDRLQHFGRYLNKGIIFLAALFFINWIITLVNL
ncbi:MAG: DUF2752 domain-containing protein, partial [Candidatus Aminicenantes bacterium]|nr:DUF2752 domain-containing protein [Candidatus Aminicenantes bacterium]